MGIRAARYAPLLGASRERSAYPDVPRREYQELIELGRVRGEEGLERPDLLLSRGVEGEAEEDDAGVGAASADDELAEVLVVGNQDPLLGSGEREHLLVGQSGGVVAADPGGVVAALGEERGDPRLGALVEQKPHSPGRRPAATFSVLGTSVLA